MSLHVISATGRHDTVAVYFKNLGRKRSCSSFGMDTTWQHWHQRAMRCFVTSFTMGWFTGWSRGLGCRMMCMRTQV